MNAPLGNAALYFIDRHRSGDMGLKPAFIEVGEGEGERERERERVLSYNQLADQSDLMASLYARHGLRREDRAVMLVLDRIEFPVIFWGSLKAGVVPVLLNTLLPADVYDTILRDARARALFVSVELFDTLKPILKDNPYLQAVFVIGGENSDSTLSFADELAKGEPGEVVDVMADEIAFWLYSSGSTGLPKGVRHVHGSLKATADTYGAQVLQIKKDDVIFSIAKMFFAYGLGNAMTFPLSVGATTILLATRPTPRSVCDVMLQTRPTLFCGVPTLYAAMLATLEEGELRAGFEKVRHSISAGEALPEDIGKRWRKSVGTDILDGVGSTELLHIFLSNAPADVAYGTSGIAVPGYDLRLVNSQGREVAVGEIGELLVKGASSADGYWNQRDKSRDTFEGVWTRTGDKYERCEDGRLIYCGRTDDMFKVSGIWVSPFEIEQALVSHDLVLEAAVVSARDDKGLEKPKAFVVLKAENSDENLVSSLKDHVKEKVGKWKYPRWIEFVEDLPKTATGKIQRFKLRDGTSDAS